MLIPFDKPLDLAHSLESGQAFRWRRGECEPGGGQWSYGVIFNNIVKVRQTPEGVEFFSAPDGETVMEPLVRDYLGLDHDLEAIYESICKDDRVLACTALYRGMRVLRQEPWECLVSFICSANSNIPRISANVEDIAVNFGRPISMGSYVRSTFPAPAALAEAGEQKLRQIGIGFRAKYIDAVARTAARGELDLYALREASYDEALEALTALPGVGDKVANCILLFSLDKLEAFPVDVWIDRALREWYLEGVNGKLPRSKMRLWAQSYFGPYAGYANQYLFHRRRLQEKG